MLNLTQDYIRRNVAESDIIFRRGLHLYQYGAFFCTESEPEAGRFQYVVDGNYGDYTTRILFQNESIRTSCDCPFPGNGCKHTVAVLLDVQDRLGSRKERRPDPAAPEAAEEEPYLTPEEIRRQAIEDRVRRSKNEPLTLTSGDMFKGEHLVENAAGRQYTVTLHEPEKEFGHCDCPDFLTNQLNTCKHLIFTARELKKKKDFHQRLARERFPFVDIYWDSVGAAPAMFCERPEEELAQIRPVLDAYFDERGHYTGSDLTQMISFLDRVNGNKRVRVRETVIRKMDEVLLDRQLAEMAADPFPALDIIRTRLYPYQEDGVRFGLYRKAALIGDEMGLGKTLQAIVLAILKRDVFDFEKVLVVTVASLKEQWKREIERFTDEEAVVVAGGADQRRDIYERDQRFFKITNYEAVLRDVTILSRFRPDLVILDEAQRIKNFNTKTADAVKRIPRKHALVLTGTPLENKLEDVYSIIQFLDPDMLSPLWMFAADHFMLSRNKKGKILGYRNLNMLHKKLKSVVIRRKKEEVLKDLPDEIVNNYYLDMTDAQRKIHAGYTQTLLPLLNKKYLTPMDLRRIQELLLCMRRVSDSTFLIDRKTNLSPKLRELEGIIDELVSENSRKVVIFSEWTTMTYLIGKQLSAAGIPFVELTGKVPVKKRQALIDEFTNNPDCKVFLSTDAGGTGLNLQAADCVINFELPWSPARMNQRIGRVNRIGQKSRCVNVVNLIMKQSIEERILAGIQLKTDLFEGVFDGAADKVEFSREKRSEMLNRLREMMGEEPEPAQKEVRPQEEIPEDTPHFLNPEVLKEEEGGVAYEQEEFSEEITAEAAFTGKERGHGAVGGAGTGGFPAAQSPEQVETVLNSGIQFLSGVLEMATGRKIETSAADGKMIRLDRETGEVTLKFKLPGF